MKLKCGSFTRVSCARLCPQDRVVSGGGGQRAEQCSQQPGLPPQASEEEGHQILHRTAFWQEGEGQAGTYGTQTCHVGSTRWALETCFNITDAR